MKAGTGCRRGIARLSQPDCTSSSPWRAYTDSGASGPPAAAADDLRARGGIVRRCPKCGRVGTDLAGSGDEPLRARCDAADCPVDQFVRRTVLSRKGELPPGADRRLATAVSPA